MRRQPDVPDGAVTGDIRQLNRLAIMDMPDGRSFPARSQRTGFTAARTGFTCRVFKRNGPGDLTGPEEKRLGIEHGTDPKNDSGFALRHDRRSEAVLNHPAVAP